VSGPGAAHAPPGAAPPRRAARVLYIDDDEAFLELLGGFLERRGYRVETFPDSAAALERLREVPDQFDVVLTDYLMPGRTGVAVAREVRLIRADLPVIVVSESVRWDLGSRSLDPCISAAIAKSDPAAVESAIERFRLGRAG
jgi:CheY-like chemotaxis protein